MSAPMANPSLRVVPLALALAGAAVAQEAAADAPALASAELIQIRPVVVQGEPAPGGAAIDLGAERARLEAWLASGEHRKDLLADPSRIAEFNQLPAAQGGPADRALRWLPRMVGRSPYNPKIWDYAYSAMIGSPVYALFGEAELRAGPQRMTDYLVELFPIDVSATHFTGADFAPESLAAQDEGGRGFALLSYQMRPERAAAYAEWTGKMLNRQAALILRGTVRRAEIIRTRITGPALLAGFTSLQEAHELILALGGKVDPATAAEARGTEVSGYDKPAQVPGGTDPSDLAAMQSAKSMLDAEKRIRQMLKEGKLTGIDRILTFEEISSWPYEDGLKGMPKQLEKLDGQQVMMIGFMLPIDDVQEMKEFLLVQSLWSCCFGQPPDINGIVRVVMKDKRIDYLFEPIRVTGKFKVVAAYEDGYCVDIYQLHADSVEVIK
jgi:hypothetical protein